MTRLCSAIALGAALAMAMGTFADEPAAFSNASATWTADGQVELSVTWEGGACEEPGEAEVMAGDGTTDEVTIPTVETAEICTMQIVPVTYSGTIPVEPRTTSLAITVLDPEGRPQAAGTVEIGMPSKAAADEGH